MQPITKLGYDMYNMIVEIPEKQEIYINGQAHDAVTLTPKFGKHMRTKTATGSLGRFVFSKAINISTGANVRSWGYGPTSVGSSQGQWRPSGVLPWDSTKIYALTGSGAAIMDANDPTVETSYIGANGWLERVVQPLGLANGNIISMVCHGSSQAQFSCDIYSNASNISGMYWGSMCLLANTDTDWIIGMSSESPNTTYGTNSAAYVYRVTKANATVTTLLTNSPGFSYAFHGGSFTKPQRIGNKYYSYLFAKHWQSDQIVKVFTYDADTATATVSDKQIAWNGFSYDYLTGVASGTSGAVAMTTMVADGGSKLVLLYHSMTHDLSSWDDTKGAFYVFDVSNTSDPSAATITCTGKLSLSGKKPLGVLDMTTDNTATKFVLVTQGGVEVYSRTGSTISLVTGYSIDPSATGVDYLGRLWMISYPDVYMLAPNQTVRVMLTMASPSYNYAGSSIATTVAVAAVNDAGAKVAKSIILSVEYGPAVFTSNGQKTLTVTTNAGSDLSVGVTITGAGQFNIVASEVV